MIPRPANEPARYVKARKFIDTLKKHDGEMTLQEYRTLREQALNGDLEGAVKGLETILYGRRWRES